MPLPKMFLRRQNLHFYISQQVNLFYDMQFKFENKVLLPKKASEFPFYNFPEHIFSNNFIIRTSTNLGKG
jgi:hypothetical protein